MVVVEVAVVL